jgi:hypothetical protein
MPWARISWLVGHDDLVTTVAEERELDCAALLV